MRVREARPGLATLVDEREHVAGLVPCTPPPGLGYELGFVEAELRERADVTATVDHDLLPLERRVEVRHDSHLPVAGLGQDEGLRRGHVLVTGAEGTRRELVGRRRVERGSRSPWPLRAAGRDHRHAARVGVAAELAAQVVSPAFFSRNGRIRSTGKTIVVDGEDPSSSSVCRYRSWSETGCSLMTAAASFSRSAAWNSPSALMILARRSRSTSDCIAMARCIDDGISTSFTSTIETLTPHGAVDSSMIPCRIALIFSRSDKSSSRTCWPSTDRNVVCAIWEVATLKFSIWTIADFGSTMRKYATAFTRTGTLSFVITSCGGIVRVIVRRSTFTIRSTTGISRNSPGPFGGSSSRPSRKTTPRSYSRATRIAEK